MPIDFSALVLGPNMTVFSRPFLVFPVASQPLVDPYPARGIWTVASLNIITEGGGVLSTSTLKLAVRLADFVISPKQGDWISVNARHLPMNYWQGPVDLNSNIDFIIDDDEPDGQGGSVFELKRRLE